MKERVKLSVLGFSLNQPQFGAYGLVLGEENGFRRLMVVVGMPEAQSIAFRLQNIHPPRPLTHDLFKPIMDPFFVSLQEVVIHEFIDGVFHSKLVLKQGDHTVEVDSRTSDAVAIAIRSNAPIYTTEEIMKELAIVIDESHVDIDPENKGEVLDKDFDFSLLKTENLEELQQMLKIAISEEDYEFASIIRDEINRKKVE